MIHPVEILELYFEFTGFEYEWKDDPTEETFDNLAIDLNHHMEKQMLEFKKFCDKNELHLDTTTGVHSVLSAEELLEKFRKSQ